MITTGRKVGSLTPRLTPRFAAFPLPRESDPFFYDPAPQDGIDQSADHLDNCYGRLRCGAARPEPDAEILKTFA
jgi:hypothetical protein